MYQGSRAGTPEHTKRPGKDLNRNRDTDKAANAQALLSSPEPHHSDPTQAEGYQRGAPEALQEKVRFFHTYTSQTIWPIAINSRKPSERPITFAIQTLQPHQWHLIISQIIWLYASIPCNTSTTDLQHWISIFLKASNFKLMSTARKHSQRRLQILRSFNLRQKVI